MIPSLRYATAFVVNVVLPTAAYHLALPHVGLMGALFASALPLIAWMGFDFLRFRHTDALSAVVLAGITLSLLILASQPANWLRAAREPLVSGVIGLLFLGSLALRRPLMFYLARSTLSREHKGREVEFDAMWTSRPALARSIRLMSAVWGITLVGETAVRLWIASSVDGDAHWLSPCLRYVTYGGLTAWTIAYRRLYLRKQ
ncbi:VC0807 family protein [Burkholderia sp. Ax-1719]|uniref:VC0807 family protein n=1 Tax=Burkholderia sp. Ax-1719 TaxID=2608334 RepID=UPI00141E051C|nr:VC0807 family protein [Burkholderia sp. Ax-1719]NIE62606.1 hypothetical protein [Burkholderia sp. Ax-1719]